MNLGAQSSRAFKQIFWGCAGLGCWYPNRVQTGSILENSMGDLSDDELSVADMWLPMTETKTLGRRLVRMCVNNFHGHDLLLERWFSIGEISQVHPFLWLILSCPQFCLLCEDAYGCIISGIFKFQVAACELLHGIVTYMLGKASQMPEGRQGPPPMYHLHKRVFPVLLRLACDTDQVSRLIYINFSLFKYLEVFLTCWFGFVFFFPNEEYFVGWNSVLGVNRQDFGTGVETFSNTGFKYFYNAV